jgi:hypothetical protein
MFAIMQSIPAIIDALRRAPEIVVPLVREVPPAILKRRPAVRRWSAHEHACHLARVHSLFFDRLDDMLTNPAPVIRPYLPGDQDPDDLLLRMNLDAALDQFVADRRRLVARLEALGGADWTRTAEHPEYRTYSVFIMFRHLALHDFLHAYRIEELLLRPEWPDTSETQPNEVASGTVRPLGLPSAQDHRPSRGA